MQLKGVVQLIHLAVAGLAFAVHACDAVDAHFVHKRQCCRVHLLVQRSPPHWLAALSCWLGMWTRLHHPPSSQGTPAAAADSSSSSSKGLSILTQGPAGRLTLQLEDGPASDEPDLAGVEVRREPCEASRSRD